MPTVDYSGEQTRRTLPELIAHMQSFSLDLKFSAGVWFFFPAGLRFHLYHGDHTHALFTRH